MGPLRIIILVVLVYIGYRLIAANLKRSDDSKTTGEPGKITDILVEDPVCGKLVPKQQAHQLKDENETHYFCSKECHDKFVSDQGEDE